MSRVRGGRATVSGNLEAKPGPPLNLTLLYSASSSRVEILTIVVFFHQDQPKLFLQGHFSDLLDLGPVVPKRWCRYGDSETVVPI